MDIDDYWLPTVDHPAHMIVKKNKIDEKIMKNLTLARYVIDAERTRKKRIGIG